VKAAERTDDGMPTCKRHRDQKRIAAICKAPMACGFPCGALFERRPHNNQFCYRHWNHRPCYFLRLPLELRSRIYEFLFPGSFVPAQLGSAILERMSTTILRVNRQIHDEAAYVLYAKRTFAIIISKNEFFMCNRVGQQGQCPSCQRSKLMAIGNGHARTYRLPLQDYQMQLMLLEQQNKRRLMMARQEQEHGGIGYQTRTCHHRADDNNAVIPSFKSPIPYALEAQGPSWIPSLSRRYFGIIRSFRIVVELPNGEDLSNAANVLGAHGADTEEYEMMIYQYCDHIHRLIGRFRQCPKRRLHLRVDINFGQEYNVLELAQAHVNLLLKPFKLLDGPAKVEVGSINAHCSDSPGQDFSTSIDQYVPDGGGRKVFDEFWKLEETMIRINQELPRVVIFHPFRDLLHAARVARERDDLTQLSNVFNTVVGLWSEYEKNQRSFHETIEQDFGDICDNLC
jgi:hypothetical protein